MGYPFGGTPYAVYNYNTEVKMRTIAQFEKAYERTGGNFMTPTVLYVERSGRFVVELSRNRRASEFMIGPLYGVTVAECLGKYDAKRRSDLSNCFTTRADAIKYIASLKDKE